MKFGRADHKELVDFALPEDHKGTRHILNLTKASHLRETLGPVFLQMHNNFSPKYFERVVTFVQSSLKANDWGERLKYGKIQGIKKIDFLSITTRK